MSIGTVDLIIERIKRASPFSPIAVFKLTPEERTIVEAEAITSKKEPRGSLNAIFASSVAARNRIQNDPLFVGTFDRRDSISLVRNQLKRIERKE